MKRPAISDTTFAANPGTYGDCKGRFDADTCLLTGGAVDMIFIPPVKASPAIDPRARSEDSARLKEAVAADLSQTDLASGTAPLVRILIDLRAWQAGEPWRRMQLTGPYACLPLRNAIGSLRDIVRGPVTEEFQREAAATCRAAAERLWTHGARWTSCAFIEAACTLEPESAWHPLELGRLAAERRSAGEAWEWYLWAARLARRRHDSFALAVALVRMGSLAFGEDRHAVAARLFRLTARIGTRCARTEVVAEAMTRLGLLRHALGYTNEAIEHFFAALGAYGPGHPGVPQLGARVAECWARERRFRGAAVLYLAVLPYAVGPTRIQAAAGAARAAAALRWEWEYAACSALTWQLTGAATNHDTLQAVLQLAHAGASMGDWVRAKQAARSALSMAIVLGDAVGQVSAARMDAVIGAADPGGGTDLDDVFPDRRAARLGLVEDWDDRDDVEPWSPAAPVRSFVASFRNAVATCPEASGPAPVGR